MASKKGSFFLHPFTGSGGLSLECVAGGVAVGVVVGIAFMRWKDSPKEAVVVPTVSRPPGSPIILCIKLIEHDFPAQVKPVVFLDKVPSDIDVSQSVTPLQIGLIAAKAGIKPEELYP
jgi:hypothetical protein